jgi:hypothetical protein
MRNKTKLISVPILALALSISPLAIPTASAEMEVTGAHWMASQDAVKDGFLMGALTIIDAERDMQGDSPTDDSVVPTLVKGLSAMTVGEIKTALDNYYTDHPQDTDKLVLHVMWDIAKSHGG